MKVSKIALAAMLALGGSTLLVAVPAEAQGIRNTDPNRYDDNREEEGEMRIQGLNRDENAAILPAYQAVQNQDWAAAAAALAAAQAGAETPAGRYVVGQLQYEIARNTNNAAMAAQAVEAMIASGAAPADQLERLRSVQASLAAGGATTADPAAVEAQLTQMLAADPNNVERLIQLAQIKQRLNKNNEALGLYRRAIEASRTTGQTAPEDMYRQALAIAYQGRMAQPATELSRQLVEAYPTPTNWRDALIIYRELGNPGEGAKLDIFRLMRAAGALTSERDYVEYAEAANSSAAFGEVKAVLEEGLSRNAITGNAAYARERIEVANGRIADDRASLAGEKATALAGSDGRAALRLGDAFFGYGQYSDAAELYRAALQKGADAATANLRLGAALALAGQRAEAETAFRAVTGPRQELANFWLLWLARRA